MSVTIIVGDVHLGRSLSLGKTGIGSSMNTRVIDQFELLDWILDQAIEKNATNLILTGDICEDVKPDYNLIVNFIKWIKRCEIYGVDVHIITGNHDLKRSGQHYTSPLDVIHSADVQNAFVYKQIDTIYNGTVGFTLMPFRDRKSFNCDSATEAVGKLKSMLQYESESIPTTYDKVVVGHLAIEGSIIVGDEFDDESNELFCPTDMFAAYDHVWMGHVHRPQVLSKKEPYVAHVGSMDLSDFGETNHQKILVVYDSSLETKFYHIPVPSRPLRRLVLSIGSNQDTTQTIIDALAKLDGLKNSILKIEVRLLGAEVPNADRSKIESEVQKYGVFHLCSFTESRTVSVVPVEKRQNMDNAIRPKSAVKIWFDSLELSAECKLKATQLSYKIIDDHEEKN